MRVIIFAAGLGRRLKNITGLPKCLIEINGETLLERYVKILHGLGLMDIALVAGYRHRTIVEKMKEIQCDGSLDGLRIIINKDFEEGSILSLHAARDELAGEILLMDGDMYFEPALIGTAKNSNKENFFLIDRTSPYDHEAVRVGFKNRRAMELARGLQGPYDILGEWGGCLKLSDHGSSMLKELVISKVSEGERESGYEFIIPELFDALTISYELVDGVKWVEIDFEEDIERAKRLAIQPLKL